MVTYMTLKMTILKQLNILGKAPEKQLEPAYKLATGRFFVKAYCDLLLLFNFSQRKLSW